jgi:pimeloyl-ACP methyl ester carboxylesterase
MTLSLKPLWRAAALSGALLLATAASAAPAPTAVAPHYRAYVDGPWGQIHVRVYGTEGQPTMIMLHKMVWSSVEFSKVQPVLAAMGVRTIAVDLPGYGLSDEPAKEPSAEDYADAMVAVLDHFHLKTVTVMGSDTGAAVATAFAVRHPGRTSHVVLEGPPLFDAATLAKLLDEPEIDRSPRHDGSEFTSRIQGVTATIPPGAMTDEELHVGAMQFFGAGTHYLYGHHAAFKYALADGLKHITEPTLVIAYPGKASIQSLPMVKAIRPDFKYVMLDFKGMMMAYDEPEPWARAVAAFIK